MSEQTELEIKENLAREEFRIRSIAEAKEKSKEIAEEIKAVLRKHGASLAMWNYNLYVVPPGFRVFSMWNFPRGVIAHPIDTGLQCNRYDEDYRMVKPFPKELIKKFKDEK